MIVKACIRIITYYNDSSDPIRRNDSPAGHAVVDYLADCLRDVVEHVDIISPSWAITGESCRYIPRYDVTISQQITLHKAPSIGGHGALGHFVKKMLSRLWLIYYLLCHISYREIIFVYHAPSLMFPIAVLSFFKKPRIIMLTEELYSDINEHKNKLTLTSEIAYLRKVSAYIFPTELLSDVVNIYNKPCLILYGAYSQICQNKRKFYDNKIHIVYAGTFEHHKGVFMAIESALNLPDNYHLHIIGYGTEIEINQVKSHIKKVSMLTSCTVSYDGFFKGEEYRNFIQKCDIGLCSQDPAASFTKTSFPSKILSYLSNGLKVVSIKIETIEKSEIASCICFYEHNQSFEVAQAIIKAASTNYDLSIIKTLDKHFRANLAKLIDNL